MPAVSPAGVSLFRRGKVSLRFEAVQQTCIFVTDASNMTYFVNNALALLVSRVEYFSYRRPGTSVHQLLHHSLETSAPGKMDRHFYVYAN
jgi:hypothetical protein